MVCWAIWVGAFCLIGFHPKPILLASIIVIILTNWFLLVSALEKALTARGIDYRAMKFNPYNPFNLSIFYIWHVYLRRQNNSGSDQRPNP